LISDESQKKAFRGAMLYMVAPVLLLVPLAMLFGVRLGPCGPSEAWPVMLTGALSMSSVVKSFVLLWRTFPGPDRGLRIATVPAAILSLLVFCYSAVFLLIGVFGLWVD
jgi:hypothetical protein